MVTAVEWMALLMAGWFIARSLRKADQRSTDPTLPTRATVAPLIEAALWIALALAISVAVT